MRIKGSGMICLTVFILSFLIMVYPSSGTGKEKIPELEGWRITYGEERQFKIPKADLGYMLQQNIISSSRKSADIILMVGSGPGDLYVPDGNISGDDRPIGFGATYETTEISGFRSVIEDYPYIGISLSIQLPGTRTLIIESCNMSKKGLKELAGIYVDKIMHEASRR